MYADTGNTKTTQLYFFAKWLWEKYRLKTRLISGDGGGYVPFVDSGMIDEGITEVFDYNQSPVAIADMRRISEGYWPSRQSNGNYTFTTSPECMTPMQTEVGRITGWNEIGAYLFDSFTSLCTVLLGHCSDNGNIGFKDSWKYTEDGYTIHGLQEGHYGIVQKEIHARFNRGVLMLPTRFIVCTALVEKGEDKAKMPFVGPKGAGRADTPQIPTWFMDVFHLEKIYEEDSVTGVKTQQQVAWFMEHLDSSGSGAMHKCKPRILPELMPELLKYFPQGYVKLKYKYGIDSYYTVLEQILKQHKQEKEKEER